MNARALAIACMMLAVGFWGCRDGFAGPGGSPGATAGVTVYPTSPGLAVGGSIQLYAVAYDIGGAQVTKDFSWSSDNTGLASVSVNGVVTGHGTGSTTIRVISEGHAGASTVTVVNAPPLAVSISGAHTVRANTTCTWRAYAGGGTPPYTYAWTPGSSSTEELEYLNAGNSFVLTVSVTDGGGQRASAVDSVRVGALAFVPPIVNLFGITHENACPL